MIGAAFLAVPSFAHAQYVGRELPHTGTFEVSGGGLWTGGYSFEAVSANETRNPTTGSGPLALFQGEPRLDGAGGAEAHLGVYLGRHVSVEGGFQFARPSLSVHTSNDFENAPETTASASVTQYVIDGSLLYHFSSGSLTPFVSGGAGYLRQLIQDDSIVETGNEIHGGGGVKVLARRRPPVRSARRSAPVVAGRRLEPRWNHQAPVRSDDRRRSGVPLLTRTRDVRCVRAGRRTSRGSPGHRVRSSVGIALRKARPCLRRVPAPEWLSRCLVSVHLPGRRC